MDAARRASVRSVNALMTATYWEVGRRIVEFEQGGGKRAEYGDALLERLSVDLTSRYGRGFARPNLIRFRQFYHAFPTPVIRSTPSNESREVATAQPPSAPFSLADLAAAFPLPWSHNVLLISRSRSPEALAFYQTETLRGGWSVRQLARQIDSQRRPPNGWLPMIDNRGKLPSAHSGDHSVKTVERIFRLEGTTGLGAKPNPSLLGALLVQIPDTLRDAVRMEFLHSSRAEGRLSRALRAASEVRLAGCSSTSGDFTDVCFEMPVFGEAAPELFAQGQLWDDGPRAESSAFDL